jgi:C4-dicarboxylate-specific signal transduction histidine kinase
MCGGILRRLREGSKERAMSESLPRILFVDDEPLVLEALRVQLRRHFQVVTAPSGFAGLEEVRKGPSFHVVVSDMRMPAMDGAVFLQRVRAVSPATVRVLLTGYSDLSDAVRAINDGYIFRLLMKPCRPDQLLSALRDAVEQHRIVAQDKDLLERKLEERTSQLLHAERLATLGTMTSGVAHEINNINTVFLSALGEVRERAAAGEPPDPVALEQLARVGQHLNTHAQQILNMGRPGPNSEAPLDLRDVTQGTLALLRTAGKTKHARVVVELPEEPVVRVLDRTRVEQVLVNLVGNAADAVWGLPGERRRLRVSLVDAGAEGATLSVEDSGVGIPVDKLGAIFEPYFTTKPQGKGTGLGLPVVQQIVGSFGGRIEVTSEVDRGTTFRVWFPASAPSAAVAAA